MRLLLSILLTIASLHLFAQAHDTLLTETARFIAGIPCETASFQTLQNKPGYKDHLNFCNSTWKELEDSTLNPMVAWAKEKSIIEDSDTGTCFYPFSGPDYLFAHQFFPNCKTYIMMGLERIGKMTDPRTLQDKAMNDYLNAIRQSQRYLLKSGYFVTSHMSQDFSRAILNGNVHLMSYFLIRTNNLIHSMEFGTIDAQGKWVSGKSPYGNYPGVCIRFMRKGESKLRSVYYFSFDAADYKIKTKPGFEKFVSSQGNFYTYIKSASYIPMHKNFSIVRNLILQHSAKILQDDTGVPFKNLDPSIYTVQLWGTYTKTIDDLSWGYDPELRKALEKSGNNTPLPFKISYNGNYGEGMMLYARRK
jgi:hypothetical protein